MTVHYQVWITFEKWDDDEKIGDEEATILCDDLDRDKAFGAFDAAQGVCIPLMDIVGVDANL